MWIWDWWLMWFVRFDAFGGPWFCVSDRTPCMCSGVGLLGTLFIQSKPLGSALSSVWYVSASFVDSSLTLRSLGEFLWFNYLLGMVFLLLVSALASVSFESFHDLVVVCGLFKVLFFNSANESRVFVTLCDLKAKDETILVPAAEYRKCHSSLARENFGDFPGSRKTRVINFVVLPALGGKRPCGKFIYCESLRGLFVFRPRSTSVP
ncbi:BnaC05g51760D [Brassica napus]|uniref:BnaC05g51760D protein n=1 Tax=Brassica napus TaxID=3708 RepID=A0A078IY62_BRANA|nr:BnaC05g51760D [Brassica napus]